MVDIKREDITLSDWTKGISVDEFTWGSYFYSEWIQTWYSTKGFKLWPYTAQIKLNERKYWYPVNISPLNWGLMIFTSDGRMETNWANGNTKWAIFAEDTNNPRYAWWEVYWTYALGIRTNWSISKVDYTATYDEDDQAVTDPDFEDWTGWTIGTWWTLVSNKWVQHTTWETWTLETTVTAPSTWLARVAVKVTWHDAVGSLTIACNGETRTVPSNSWNGWYVFSMGSITSGNTYTITITPSSSFEGYVASVNFHVFDTSKITTISWLSASDTYRTLVWQWDIYIAYGSKIKTLSTVDRTLGSELSLVNNNETIVSLTQQAWSLIIWTTDGLNSKQYYWDWVWAVASEVIEWKWQVIKAVEWTETVAYVLCAAQSTADAAAFRLYSVNWYQRSLIASNSYEVGWVFSEIERFNKRKKFVFNDVDWPQSMCIYMDNLYIPWCWGIYQFWQTLPWVWNAWSRPIRYPSVAQHFCLTNVWDIRFAYSDWDYTSYYSIVYSDNFVFNWLLATDYIYWDKLSSRKAIEQLKIWYKSIPKEDWNIKIYAVVDDDYFWRIDVKSVTDRPKIWDVYTIAEGTTWEIISINKTSSTTGELWFRTITNWGSLLGIKNTLTKVSGDWDASISAIHEGYDNMVLVKTIETDQQEYGSDFIFWKDFVNSYMPYRHKLQLVIELNKKDNWIDNFDRTPEIYEISMVADITDTVL